MPVPSLRHKKITLCDLCFSAVNFYRKGAELRSELILLFRNEDVLQLIENLVAT